LLRHGFATRARLPNFQGVRGLRANLVSKRLREEVSEVLLDPIRRELVGHLENQGAPLEGDGSNGLKPGVKSLFLDFRGNEGQAIQPCLLGRSMDRYIFHLRAYSFLWRPQLFHKILHLIDC
jgi:hypothetical protein